MYKIFNTLIDSYIDNNVGVAENFLTERLAAHLKENLDVLYQNRKMQNAGTGNDTLAIQNKAVRSDQIYWLDSKHNDPHENEFFELMDDFVKHLNSTCYTSITSYEFHYALYEKGTFYKKHIDQFRNNDSRQFSMIMYLNEKWQNGDGGELCIHHDTFEQKITPINGKSVFFKSSELLHEVVLTNQPRMSITGWLKCDL